jgi:di/tricarboxylate transporter
MRNTRTRRALLVLAGLVFVGIALASLLAPHEMADGLGYSLASTDALNEFRAVYVGLWLATAVLFFTAAWRADQALLGDMAALLILGQVFGRVLSLALDGSPSARIWPMFFVEAIGGLAILFVRPGRPPSGLVLPNLPPGPR